MILRSSSRSLFIALLAFTQGAFASPINCEDGATNMAEVRACLEEQQTDQVEAAYSQTYAYVKARDKKSASLLEIAQKSWKVFAENSCEYSVAARKTSQLENDARLMCLQKFRDARVKALNAYRQEFGKAP